MFRMNVGHQGGNQTVFQAATVSLNALPSVRRCNLHPYIFNGFIKRNTQKHNGQRGRS